MVKGKKAAAAAVAQQKELERQKELEQRLKLLESSSSSSTETESTESFTSLEEEHVDVGTVAKPEDGDFFEGFREIPNVETISEDISVASVVIEKTVHEMDASKDMGKFVNPLTGLEMRGSASSSSSSSSASSSSSSSEEQKEDDEIYEDDEGSVKDLSQESEILLPKDMLDLEEDVKKPAAIEDTLETFLELEIETEVVQAEEIDWEALAREEEALRIQQNTQNFLNELINKAVEMAEYVSPERILKLNLDKRKLLMELAARYSNYLTEKSCCEFLNRQIVQHFRRKKTFRPITEDNQKTVQQDKQKLYFAKKRLDEILAREVKLLSSSTNVQTELREQYDTLKKKLEEQIQIFEGKVRKYLIRESWPKLNGIIEQLLLKMGKYRKEVSEVRFTLFLKQHTQARLTQLLTKLEDLGNGLNMKDFSHLQAENQALDKKIEERNAELNKLHLRCHKDLHTLAHYKEKQQMLCTNITIQTSVLDALLENKHMLREHLYALKLQRNRISSQIKKLSSQGGLLDKPALMFDYDHTVDRCREQREIVNRLRQTMHLIQRKIDEIVKHCSHDLLSN
ncbi:Coiled-coil domain-containing protein 96 [Lucilia cuprina]|nr:Coiled-coil domain-containing protein 96 [Lucilia cuprina]